MASLNKKIKKNQLLILQPSYYHVMFVTCYMSRCTFIIYKFVIFCNKYSVKRRLEFDYKSQIVSIKD